MSMGKLLLKVDRKWLWVLIALIGAVYAWVMWDRVFLHDDLNYFNSHENWIATHRPAFLRLPTHIAGFWLTVNGRMGDALNILWLNMIPRWCLSLLLGAMVSGMFAMVVVWIKSIRRSVPAEIIATAFLLLALPWWDNGMLMVIQFNYVWTTALILGVLWIVFKTELKSGWNWALVPLAFVVGCWHEASGVPVACGLTVYLLLNGKNGNGLSRINRWMVYALIAGGLASVCSPGIWSRAAADSMADDSLPLLLLKSDSLSLVLLVVSAVLFIVRRARMFRLSKTVWGVFAVYSVVSMAISAYSGIVGRSGWFSQVTALISLYGLWVEFSGRPERSRTVLSLICTILLAVMTVHVVGFGLWQKKANREAGDVVSLFKESESGTVFYDLVDHDSRPWWLLGKVYGMLPLYDDWNRHMIQSVYGPGKRLSVVPTCLREIDYDSIGVSCRVGRHIVDRIFPGASPDEKIAVREGRNYFIRPFEVEGTTFYLTSPVTLDPGYRVNAVNVHNDFE